jgi:hypothetical protein
MSYFWCSAKRGRPRKAENNGSNQSDMVPRKKRGPSLRTETQDLPAPPSVPQNDIDTNLGDSGSSTVKDILDHLSMSVFKPPDPMPQKISQSTQKQYRPIIINPGPTPSAISEEKQVEEQRIDDPMSPLSPCTETDSLNASPARSTISLQDDSVTVSLARHFMFC